MANLKLPPGPGKKHRFRHMIDFTANRAEFLDYMRKEYGDFCYFCIGPASVYLINEPELVKEVLLKHKEFPKTNSTQFLKGVLGEGLLVSGGEFHRRQRRLMQPAFHPKRVATYGDTIAKFADAQANAWQDGAEIDLVHDMSRLTLLIISEVMFHVEADDLLPRVQAALDVLLPIIDKMARPGGNLMMHIPTVGNRRFFKARRDLNGIIYDIIAKARARGEDTGDLLSMLLFAKDEEGDGQGMADEFIRDEALTIFLAGHETTALGLSWTWYLLSQHPEVLEKLRAELDEVLGGRLPTMEDVPRLPYLKMVISESMRIYPPAYLIDRTPLEDWDTGRYIIPKGAYIMVSPYTMGRNDTYYPDPTKFDPMRWTPEEIEKRPKWSYFPFGGGPRTCIGEHFAWAELLMIMATLAQRWSMSLVPGQTIGTKPLITLRASTEIRMQLHERSHKPALAAT